MTLAYSDTSKQANSVPRPFLPAAFRERGAWRYQNDASSAADSQQARAGASASRAWRLAPPRASGPFIAYNRTCDACDAMGWVTLPTSELAAWRCCGTAMPKSARARADKGGRRARPTAVGRPAENWQAYSYSVG